MPWNKNIEELKKYSKQFGKDQTFAVVKTYSMGNYCIEEARNLNNGSGMTTFCDNIPTYMQDQILEWHPWDDEMYRLWKLKQNGKLEDFVAEFNKDISHDTNNHD